MAREIEPDRIRYGEILFNLRLEEGMTQADVANAISCTEGPTLSERHYRRIEKGEMTPSVTLGVKLANLFGVTAEDIWG